MPPPIERKRRPGADAVIKEAAQAGQIARHGHLHWVRVTMTPGSRALKSGRLVPEYQDEITLKVDSRVPTKYVLIDLETGEAWEGTAGGSWTRAAAQTREEAAPLLCPPKTAKAVSARARAKPTPTSIAEPDARG